jgi:hypothetical protein
MAATAIASIERSAFMPDSMVDELQADRFDPEPARRRHCAEMLLAPPANLPMAPGHSIIPFPLLPAVHVQNWATALGNIFRKIP